MNCVDNSAESEILNNRIHWDQFYEQRPGNNAPSLFAQYVVGQCPGRNTIVEIGCGDGRDALWFCSQGFRVIGFDASRQAIARCRQRAKPSTVQCDFHVLDVGQESLMGTLEDYGVVPPETLIYARFFLHAINTADEQVLLRDIAPLVRRGARFCVEARSVEDEDLPKAEAAHFRRFISLPQLELQCRALGMKLEKSQTGQGLAPYKHENPMILRAIFRSDSDDPLS